MMKGNKELVDELNKRFMLIDKAHKQILVGNYGIARKLLEKVLYEPFEIGIEDD